MSPLEGKHPGESAREGVETPHGVPSGTSPSELRLLERIRGGDSESLGVLMKRYWRPLVAYAQNVVGDQDVAQDVVQTAFVQVWKRRAEWDANTTANAYLYRIVRNLSLNAMRDMSLRRIRHEEGGRGSTYRSTSIGDPEADLHASRMRQEVEAAISSLSERRREIFVLSRFHGLSHGEIAEALGISPQTVANQMSAALEALRDSLARYLKET